MVFKLTGHLRHNDNDDAWDKVVMYSGILCGVALISFISSYITKLCMVISENMTKAVRKALYTSIIYKHIGWFDKRKIQQEL